MRTLSKISVAAAPAGQCWRTCLASYKVRWFDYNPMLPCSKYDKYFQSIAWDIIAIRLQAVSTSPLMPMPMQTDCRLAMSSSSVREPIPVRVCRRT